MISHLEWARLSLSRARLDGCRCTKVQSLASFKCGKRKVPIAWRTPTSWTNHSEIALLMIHRLCPTTLYSSASSEAILSFQTIWSALYQSTVWRCRRQCSAVRLSWEMRVVRWKTLESLNCKRVIGSEQLKAVQGNSSDRLPRRWVWRSQTTLRTIASSCMDPVSRPNTQVRGLPRRKTRIYSLDQTKMPWWTPNKMW